MTTVFTGASQPARRQFLRAAASCAVSSLPVYSLAQSDQTPERQFAPQPGAWRTFEVTTRVEIAAPRGQTRVWVPDWNRMISVLNDREEGTSVQIDFHVDMSKPTWKQRVVFRCS